MSLELVIGPMFSGKSTKLIRKIQLAKSINKKVLVIKPLIETRYGENKLSSHSLEYELCQSSSTLEHFSNDVLNYDVIVIDEDGKIFHESVNDMPLGRNVNEYLRLIDAYTHVQTKGEVCPANWEEGKEAMSADRLSTAAYLASN